jgi:AraC family transcriptional regulator of adaptative response / DNA-3-methyladenine glycosylase II
VHLPTALPFAGDAALAFLATRCVAGVDEVAGRTYRRAGAVVEVVDDGALVHEGDPARARRLLDLDADPGAIDPVLASDAVLAPLVAATPGLRVPGAWDPFELLVRAVVGQQVTVAAARTLLTRVLDRCGGTLTAEALAGADLDALGMPASRVGTLQAIAEAGVDPADAAALLAIRGVGPWTAGYVALRSGDPDAFPVGDAGLRVAAGRLGLPTDTRALAARAERWRPYRAYAVVHLWSTL